ncbi:PEP-CTERM protein sorting domain protein [Sedimentisphaera cyanobacteriorum]|uniref:PEP-CTERM protein sorting domain protein n=1 Tax=Sedimentisphaera cyanobacteriorum TaxID=1940790 RepID=A0A1Q2HPE0_9BACT|nr:PEP-CTERM sorting domain-containing protein [Sedimentisphaera cyanobacteriorum]AQQ09093.1 PEP-CTERM protein sorting domain protein [Sedimentisphaera cyanobacteriorum]
MKNKFITVVILTSLVCMPAIGQMELRIDLGNSSDDPAEAGWNTLSLAQLDAGAGLIDFNTELSTGVSVSGSGFDYKQAGGWDNSTIDWVDQAVAEDFVYSINSSSQIDFDGLHSEKVYQVEVLSSWISQYSVSGITVQGEYADENYNSDATQQELESWCAQQAYNDSDWLVWEAVSPEQNGMISAEFTVDSQAGAFYSNANAIRITEIPEPASMIMLGAGGIGMLVRRRKRN